MTKMTHFVCCMAFGRTHGKLPKNRNLLKFKTNQFCFDDKQGFLNPYTKFKAGFIFEPISSGRKLRRRTLKTSNEVYCCRIILSTTFKTSIIIIIIIMYNLLRGNLYHITWFSIGSSI